MAWLLVWNFIFKLSNLFYAFFLIKNEQGVQYQLKTMTRLAKILISVQAFLILFFILFSFIKAQEAEKQQVVAEKMALRAQEQAELAERMAMEADRQRAIVAKVEAELAECSSSK